MRFQNIEIQTNEKPFEWQFIQCNYMYKEEKAGYTHVHPVQRMAASATQTIFVLTYPAVSWLFPEGNSLIEVDSLYFIFLCCKKILPFKNNSHSYLCTNAM